MLSLMRMYFWNSIRVWISYRSFWQKWNFISGDKISCKHYPKWNAYTFRSSYRVVLKCSRDETACEQNFFHVGLKSQTGITSFRLSCELTLSNERAHYVYDKLSKMVARSKILLLFVRKGLGTWIKAPNMRRDLFWFCVLWPWCLKLSTSCD